MWKLTLLICLVLTLVPKAFGYIDPGTTTTVLSGLGALLAAVATAGMFFLLLIRRFFKAIWIGITRALWACFGSIWKAAFAFSLIAVICLATILVKPNWGIAPAAGKRVIVLGFDGMDPKLTKTFMEQGELPNLARLSGQGDFKPLQTVNPVESPVVWTTMATGANPSLHRVTDFIKRQGGTYQPTLGLTKHATGNFSAMAGRVFEPPVDPGLFVWDQLGKAGVPVSVMRWPMTFPAQGDGVYLTGLGTPDLLGNMGRYTLITENAEEFNPSLKGKVLPLSFSADDMAVIELEGPIVSGILDQSQSQAKLSLRKTNDGVEISTNVRKITLEAGQLGPWMRVDFEGSLGRSVSGIVQFMVLNQDPMHIYMSPLQIDPTNPLYPVSNPNGFAEEIAGKFGYFHTIGLAEDTNALVDEVINEDQFLTLSDRVMLEAENIFFDQLANRKSGMVGYVFDTVDRVSHVFWRYLDESHPAHDSAKATEYQSVIRRFYRKADAIVGRVLAQLDPDNDTLLIVSDHGFSSYRRSVHLNTWLIDQGYMKLKPGVGEVGALFEEVDWSETTAFALGFSQIYFNVKGRDPQGVVEPGRVDFLRHELSSKLAAMTDELEGVKPIDKVYSAGEAFGASLPYGPEIVVGLKPGYRFSWQTAMGAAPPYTFEDNLKAWSGDHIINATHVPGVIFSNKTIGIDEPSVYDIAPTILELFGLPKSAQMQGRNLFNMNPS